MVDDPSPAQPSDPAAGPEGDNGAAAEAEVQMVNRVRETLGLKEGQRIDRLIDSRVEGAISNAFGLEKGQKALEVIGTFVADEISKRNPPAPEKPDPQGDLKADLDAVKKTTRELMEAKDHAEAAALSERRRSLIRDSLDGFDINPDLKGLVTRGFVEGVEANPEVIDGELSVKDAQGAPQLFAAYLKDYFTQNKSFLAQPKFGGSGARSGGGRPATGTFDFNKSGRELTNEYAKAAKENPDGALETLNKQNDDRAARLGMPS